MSIQNISPNMSLSQRSSSRSQSLKNPVRKPRYTSRGRLIKNAVSYADEPELGLKERKRIGKDMLRMPKDKL